MGNYSVGQLIWLKNLSDFSGHRVKSTRLCLVRRVYDNNKIDVRTISTIYSDKVNNIPARTLKEAEEVLKNLFESKFPENVQYVILEPSKDNVLNMSFTFGNMISKKIDLNEIENEPLLDRNGNPAFISETKEVELYEREAEAIAENIIKNFRINSKRTVNEEVNV